MWRKAVPRCGACGESGDRRGGAPAIRLEDRVSWGQPDAGAHEGCRGQSHGALARGLAALAVAAGLMLVTGAVGAEPAARSASAKIPVIYQKKRSFRIPFHIDEQGRARLKEVQLWVSEDSGFHWEPRSRTTPDLGKFTFRTAHDGEYWFATRTLTVDDEYSPPMNQTVEPSMKVIVDTNPPSLVLEPDGRRGSTATVRWEVKDEYLDLKTLLLEYQVEGAKDWRKVPIRRVSLLGAQSWDAGTADAIRVRASVADKAGNVADAEINLPEGTAGDSDFAAIDRESPAPPVEQISRPGSSIAEGPGFPPIQESTGPGLASSSRSGSRRSLAARRTRSDDGLAGGGAVPPAPDWDRAGAATPGNTPIASAPFTTAIGTAPMFANPFPSSETAARGGTSAPGGSPLPTAPLASVWRRRSRSRGRSNHAGSQSPVQAAVRHRGRRPEWSSQRGAMAHPGRRTHLDSPR